MKAVLDLHSDGASKDAPKRVLSTTKLPRIHTKSHRRSNSSDGSKRKAIVRPDPSASKKITPANTESSHECTDSLALIQQLFILTTIVQQSSLIVYKSILTSPVDWENYSTILNHILEGISYLSRLVSDTTTSNIDADFHLRLTHTISQLCCFFHILHSLFASHSHLIS